MELIYRMFEGLPRQGPGCDDCTQRAYDCIPVLPPAPSIVDVGCGTGWQSRTLARISGRPVMAIDNHLPFLRILAGNTRQQGPAERVQPAAMSMFDLGLAEGSVDLLWCEGAIYVIGFEEGLRRWRPLLTDQGCVALTDLCWLRPDPPEIPRAYWAEFYPAIAPTQDRCEAARKAGYQVLSTFVLPESSWWEQCYTPLERRLTELMAEFASDSEALDELHTTQQEIEIYRRYSEYYGYVFFILQKHS